MSQEDDIHRELERHHSQSVATVPRGLRPWFAHPVVVAGTIAVVVFLAVVLLAA